MKKDGTGKHDQVVNTLLDLQARLREEGVPDTADEVITIPDVAPPTPASQPVSSRAFAPVTQLPTSGAADDRIAEQCSAPRPRPNCRSASHLRAPKTRTEHPGQVPPGAPDRHIMHSCWATQIPGSVHQSAASGRVVLCGLGASAASPERASCVSGDTRR